jgi:FkbM family methyltransferase
MLLSKTVPQLGRIYHPLGAGAQFADLVAEIDEYFQHGITLERGDVVFDVGANIGAFALHAAKRAGGGLRFYNFEPIPEVFSALARNFETNALLADCERTLFPMGLTAIGAPDAAEFHYFKRLPCDTTQHIDEKRSEFAAFFEARGAAADQAVRRVLPGGLGRATGKSVSKLVSGLPRGGVSQWFFDRAIGVTKLRCPLTTIEAVVEREKVKRIDLLKVDVEGAELEVLQGVGPKAWPLVRQVVLEGHDKDGRLAAIEQLLRDNGFDEVHSEVPPLAVERALNNFVLHARRTRS